MRVTRWPGLGEFPADALSALVRGAKARDWDVDGLLGHIASESGFDPQAKNPFASASGLIQVTDQTARALGFRDAAEVRAMPAAEQVRRVVFPFFEMMGGPYRSGADYKIAGFGKRPTIADSGVVVPAEHVGINPGFSVDAATGAVLAAAVRSWWRAWASRFPPHDISRLVDAGKKKGASSGFDVALAVILTSAGIGVAIWRMVK